MKRKKKLFLPGATGLFFIIILYFLFFSPSCTINKYYQNAVFPLDTIDRWVDWNVSFKDGVPLAGKLAKEQDLENYINVLVRSYNNAHSADYIPSFKAYYCPCDSSLFNFSVTLINGSGQSAGSPPKPPPPAGGSGDVLDYISPNNVFEAEVPLEGHLDSVRATVNTNHIDPSSILAIIDTGLDTSFFKPDIAKLLWQPLQGAPMYDFTIHSSVTPDRLLDDHLYKHGTAVTAFALQAIARMTDKLPRIMVLKALDKDNVGSSFTVSCAVSYAVQNHASMINASLGYYSTGEVDSVLLKYFSKTKSREGSTIAVMAAAGNRSGKHDEPELCNTPSTQLLTNRWLFFPACFNQTLDNITIVTTLKDQKNPCFYQNFSPQFVDVGVINKDADKCCRFVAPFLRTGYEGSSFATPIFSGLMMGCLLNHPGATNCFQSITQTDALLRPFVKDGRYVTVSTLK